jgi:hypothetical protein
MFQIFMAILAFDLFGQVVTAWQVFGRCCMEFVSFVAVHTVHIAFQGMHIPLAPFAKVFITHTAAVAGRTLVQYPGPFIKVVTVDKTAAH